MNFILSAELWGWSSRREAILSWCKPLVGGDMGYYHLLGGGFATLSGARQAQVWVTVLVQSSCKANWPVVLC